MRPQREELRIAAWWSGWDDFVANRPRPAQPHAAEGWQSALEAARIPVAFIPTNDNKPQENDDAHL
jgi:protein tyrosine phosphatase (PTP) superfamily phosphohydrolase (DUF442 family)